jgi:HK97 family phage portal protein
VRLRERVERAATTARDALGDFRARAIASRIEPSSVVARWRGADPTVAASGGGNVGSANRCLQLVCQQISTMPLRFRGNFEPVWVTNPDPVWFPNGIGDAVFAVVWSIYAWGDAFLYVTDRYETTGYPRLFTVLDPAAVSVDADPAGGRRYRAGGVLLDGYDVIQVSRCPNGALRSTSALTAYVSNLTSASAAESFAASFFLAGGVPWGALKPQRRLDSTQAADLQAQWVDRANARNGAPAVLPPDVEFQQFQFNPKDLLLLESREWDAKQIAAAFGVPAFMLNLDQAGGLNYTNPEMLFETWWRTELYPVGRRIESALSVWLPRGNWVEFDPSATLKPDLATMTTTWLALQTAGIVTDDEVRAAVLDLPPLAEGPALDLIDEPPGANVSPIDPATAPVTPALEVVAS